MNGVMEMNVILPAHIPLLTQNDSHAYTHKIMAFTTSARKTNQMIPEREVGKGVDLR